MERRDFLASMVALVCAPVIDLRWPFVEVDWLVLEDDPDLTGWYAVKHIRSCDLCYEGFGDDVSADKPIRKFYMTTDGEGLCVCEHCTVAYLAEVGEYV